MDAAAGPLPTPLDGKAPVDAGLERFRRRARWLFTIIAIAEVIAAVIVLASIGRDLPPFPLLLLGTGVGASLAAAGLLIAGLRGGRPWADRATVVVCAILVVTGIVRAVVRLMTGAIDIPLDAIGAVLVLAARPAVPAPLTAGERPRFWLVVVLALIAALSVPLADRAATGDLLGASPDDVTLAVSIDCSHAPLDPSRPVIIRGSWTWRGWEPLPGSTDGFVVRWRGPIAEDGSIEGQPSGFYLGGQPRTDPSDGVWVGSGSPATALTPPLETAGDLVAFGVDVGKVGLGEGRVAVPLLFGGPFTAPTHGTLEASVAYAHLDRWLVESEPTVCAW